ncbi:MAG TPA: hypothetical protein K8W07_03335, partial [Bacteroides togonis]|nr:hypothetical protein [Bacteroides togonis]
TKIQLKSNRGTIKQQTLLINEYKVDKKSLLFYESTMCTLSDAYFSQEDDAFFPLKHCFHTRKALLSIMRHLASVKSLFSALKWHFTTLM